MSKRQVYEYSEYKLAREQAMSFARNARPGEVAYVIGPGGCGKTAISKYVLRYAYGDPSAWPAGKIPAIWVEADNSDRGFFSPITLVQDMLEQVHDPFRSTPFDILGWDVPSGTRQRLLEAIVNSDPNRDSERKMRKAFVGIARLAGLKLIIIDEGNLLVLTHLNRAATDYLESIRVMANKIGCAVLICGTVDMEGLMGHSGQLNRRSDDILVDRMRCETHDGMCEFVGYLKHVEGDESLPEGILVGHAREVFDATYGIPGEIRGLVDRALRLTEAKGNKVVTWQEVVEKMHNPQKIKIMKAEADYLYGFIKGESKAEDPNADEKSTRAGRRPTQNPRRRPVGVGRR